MAFSSFRLLMASGNTTPPFSFSDTFGQEVPWAIAQSFSANDIWITPGTSTDYYATGSGSSRYIWRVNHNTSFTQQGVRFTLAAGTSTHIHSDMIDSTHVLVAYNNASNIICQRIQNITGTLSAQVGATTAVTGGGTLDLGICTVLDSTNSLVLGIATATNTNNRLSLINTSTLAAIQSNTSATSINGGTNVAMFKISATLAVIMWVNASNQIQLSTVDVTSGTSFTLNAAYNTTIANGTAGAQLYALSSTTALMVYYKSANTIAAQVVTFAAGGSVTLGTEYTASAPGIPSSIPPFRIAAYGSAYIIGYGEVNSSNGGRIFASSVQVSGSVVTFNSAGFSVIGTAGSYSVLNNYNSGGFIPVDSTHLAVVYGGNTTGGRYWNSGYVDVNPSIATWGTFNGNNSSNYTIQSTYTDLPTICYLGTNRVLAAGYDPLPGTLQFYSVTSGGGAAGSFVASSPVDSTITSGVSAMCPLSYSTSSGVSRALAAYCSSSNTITTQVISLATDGTPTLNTSTTFSAGASNNITTNQNGRYVLVQLGSDTALFLGFDHGVSPDGIGGNVIQVTAGALTISATNTFTNLIHITGEAVQNGNNFLQFSRIDSSHVAIIFMTKNTGTNLYSLKMCIMSVSGTTVTVGTIQNIVTGYTNPPQNFGISVLDSTKGIVTYADDAATGTILYAAGFTYSGTTITLGTQNSLATSLSFAMRTNGNGNGTMVPVSSTEAMATIVDTATNNPKLYLLTYVNNNSITAGTPITSSVNATVGYGLVTTDNYNDTFMIWNQSVNTTAQLNQYYRG